jgi:hypothetical protein
MTEARAPLRHRHHGLLAVKPALPHPLTPKALAQLTELGEVAHGAHMGFWSTKTPPPTTALSDPTIRPTLPCSCRPMQTRQITSHPTRKQPIVARRPRAVGPQLFFARRERRRESRPLLKPPAAPCQTPERHHGDHPPSQPLTTNRHQPRKAPQTPSQPPQAPSTPKRQQRPATCHQQPFQPQRLMNPEPQWNAPGHHDPRHLEQPCSLRCAEGQQQMGAFPLDGGGGGQVAGPPFSPSSL